MATIGHRLHNVVIIMNVDNLYTNVIWVYILPLAVEN